MNNCPFVFTLILSCVSAKSDVYLVKHWGISVTPNLSSCLFTQNAEVSSASASGSNLNRGSSHWVIEQHCEERRGRQLILRALQPLPERVTHTQTECDLLPCMWSQTGCGGKMWVSAPYEHLANHTVHTVRVCVGRPLYPPGVYDVLFPASQSVAVEDEVTVSAVEVTVEGGIHGRLCSVLNAPNLKARSQPCFAEPSHVVLSTRLFKNLHLLPGLCPCHRQPCRAGLPWPCWSAGWRRRRAPVPLWLCCRWCRPYWGP